MAALTVVATITQNGHIQNTIEVTAVSYASSQLGWACASIYGGSG